MTLKFHKVIFFVACAVIGTVTSAFELDLRTAKIETGYCGNNESRRCAVQELEKHLSMIAKRQNHSAYCSDTIFVIGQAAPGCKEAEAHEARACVVDGKLYFWGDDTRGRWGTLYAVYGFLESVLGVKWVEPGDRGIVFTTRNSVEVPNDWTYRYYPPLEMSVLRESSASPAALLNPKFYNYAPLALRVSEKRTRLFSREWTQWMRRHRHQSRKRFAYGHAFTKWNERFAETKPELLALDKDGRRGYPGEKSETSRKARWIKLCVSNPQTVDQIIFDWCHNSNTNEYLNVCPNDADGYCRCDKCKSWDADLPGEDFNVHKTDRYVRFWNAVAEKARAIRPDVKVVAYAYASYRMPPRRVCLSYPDNMLIGTVPSLYDDFEEMVIGWKKKGLKHYFMRPNHLCHRTAPVLGRERRLYDDFQRNLAVGMIGVDESSTPRPQAYFEIYTIARLITEPTLPFETIETEFLSQYGTAAMDMKEYFTRVRNREAMNSGKQLEVELRRKTGESLAILDDSQLYGAAYAAHDETDYDGDLDVVVRALSRSGLSEIEKWRVNRVRAMIENAKLTRKFIYARDNMKITEFAKIGRELILKRIELKDEIDDVCWGHVFRNYPAEVRWWMPIKDGYLREFWDPKNVGKVNLETTKGENLDE